MKTPDYNRIPDFDDIVFEERNKEYGAYQLRRRYDRNLLTGLLFGIIIMTTATLMPFLTARAHGTDPVIIPDEGPIILQKLDNLIDKVAPPPADPDPEPLKKAPVYLPPEVVDTVRPDEYTMLIADDINKAIKDLKVIEPVNIDTASSEVPDMRPAEKTHTTVEEMPMFPGGNEALLKYISGHVIYPEVSRQNNIQGKVIVKFCVTSAGGIDSVSILKGADPELDAEAMRVVKTFPAFIPGKQNGKPVPVWFIAPINFQLK